MSDRGGQCFSDHRDRAVNLEVIEARGFDERGLLVRDALELGGWFHDTDFVEGFHGTTDDDAAGRDALVGGFRVVGGGGGGNYAGLDFACLAFVAGLTFAVVSELFCKKVRN